MGASLQFRTRALTAEIRAAACAIGSRYAVNTVGAAAGGFITSWVLLPKIGLAQTLYVGVAFNAVCAGSLLAALIFTRRPLLEVNGIELNEASVPELFAPSGFRFQTWFLLYFLSGFVALSL